MHADIGGAVCRFGDSCVLPWLLAALAVGKPHAPDDGQWSCDCLWKGLGFLKGAIHFMVQEMVCPAVGDQVILALMDFWGKVTQSVVGLRSA